MKKKILILIIIIVMALPVINGFIMEKTIQTTLKNINDINQESGSPYSIKVIRYDRRLFHSDIEWQIDLGSMKSLAGVDNIIIHDRVKHRILGVTTTSDLNTNSWYREFVKQQPEGKDPLTIITKYSLFGKIESNLSVTPFATRVDNLTLDVGESHLTTTTTRDIDYIKTNGELKSFSIEKLLALDDLTVSSDLNYLSPYIWTGDMDVEFAKLTMTQGKEKGELDDFVFTYTVDMDKKADKISSFTTFKGDAFSTPDNISIKDITAKIAFKNVDRKGYEAFMEQYTKVLAPLTRQAFDNTGDMVDNKVNSQIASSGMQMIGSLEKLLTKDLEFVIEDVSMDFPEGKVSAEAHLKLLKDMTMMQFFPLLAKPSNAPSIFSLRSKAKIPASLLKDSSFLTTPLSSEMKTGIFQQKKDMLVHSSKTEDNDFFLNGHKVDLDLLR